MISDSSQSPPIDLPRQPGTYALVYFLIDTSSISVGKLGSFVFPAGFYIYIGSALGPGGLAGRISRHIMRLTSSAPPHWHIDYLSSKAALIEIWYDPGPDRMEHLWAEAVRELKETQVPVPRFGASDCRCESHLFLLDSKPDVDKFFPILSLANPGHSTAVRYPPPGEIHE